MKPHLTLLPLFFFLGIYISTAQTIFEIPDTVCVGDVLEIQTNGDLPESICLVSEANFLSYDISVEPIATFPSDYSPLYSQIVQDGENYFSFSSVFDDNKVVRLDFGNSLNNEPISNIIPLENMPVGQEGIQILNDDGRWWGFMVGGWAGVLDPEHLLRLDFGDNLTNNPIVENLGNIGDLAFPHDLFITKENGEWVGLTSNKIDDSMTRFDFGNSLANTPTGIKITNVGVKAPTGFAPIRVDGKWYLMVTNESDDSITRLNFGTSLKNTPNSFVLGNLNFIDAPRDLSVTKFCDDYLGILINRIDGQVTSLNFGDDIENIPTTAPFGNFGGFDFPHSISASQLTDEGVVIFIDNRASNEITRIDFILPFGLEVNCQSSIDDFEVVYSNPGIYTLQFLIDEGLPTQSSFCKNVFVTAPPDLDIGDDKFFCEGEPVVLESAFASTIWQGQTLGTPFEVSESGTYIGETTIGACTVTDSVEVVFEDCESCFQFPNAFTPNGDLVNDKFQPVLECDIEITEYELIVFNRWGQKVFQSNDPLQGWDGKFKGQHSTADVFVWRSYFVFSKNNKLIEESGQGDVTLIR